MGGTAGVIPIAFRWFLPFRFEFHKSWGMKAMTLVFWIAVGGIAVSLAGTVYTYVNQRPPEQTQVIAIPTPAVLPGR
ncbi:MAG: hypothetical protein A2Z97_06990 [Bdellovibrionales bacterium GWB1_52_6]|nr:MAG: hypothetical protein A2Z97_06990 [Bdellovibrionales bacterium GWB1_52_6]OFZ05448.1 MAG: hypothetical protein A2X97_11260 [Bdellovibrionales bacterium GWA1_52_35]